MGRKKIGEILIEQGIITRDQLRVALTIQKRDRGIKLGAILILLNYITAGQLLDAMDEQRKSPRDINDHTVS